MKNLTVVVMAAGIGSRYGGLKQVEPAGPNGEALVHYSIYDAWKSGFDRTVFIIRKDIEADFRDKIGRRIEKQIDTSYVFQSVADVPPDFALPAGRVKPWGTGQAILACRETVQDPFLVINADDFYGRSSFLAMAEFLKKIRQDKIHDFALAGFRLANTLSEYGHVTRAVCRISDDGYLEDIKEIFKIRKSSGRIEHSPDGNEWIPLPPDNPVSMNFWGFTPGLFEELARMFPEFLRENAKNLDKAEFLIPEIIGTLIRIGRARVKVIPTPEKWFGVTYPQDMTEVRKSILELIGQGVYPAPLWA